MTRPFHRLALFAAAAGGLALGAGCVLRSVPTIPAGEESDADWVEAAVEEAIRRDAGEETGPAEETGPGGAPGAAGAGDPAAYRLQPGDQVSLQVFREPELSGTYRVDSSGMIRHALIGSFPVANRTVAEAEAALVRLLEERYLVHPRVVLSVVSTQSSNVVVLGEVRSPGVHPIPFGETITLLQAVARAGGFTGLASVNRVTVIRTVEGREQSIRARVSRMISGEDPDMPLLPNDVIMVPQVVF